MTRRGYRLTEIAAEDVARILEESALQFGPVQQEAYAGLLETALAKVVADPGRPGSRDRSDLAPGLRSFHVELAARRRGAASHIVYDLPARPGENGDVIVVRVVHEAMDPVRHIPGDPPWRPAIAPRGTAAASRRCARATTTEHAMAERKDGPHSQPVDTPPPRDGGDPGIDTVKRRQDPRNANMDTRQDKYPTDRRPDPRLDDPTAVRTDGE